MRHKLLTSRSSEEGESAFCMDWKHWTFHEGFQLQMLLRPVCTGTIQLLRRRGAHFRMEMCQGTRNWEKLLFAIHALALGVAEHVTAIKKRERKCTELADVRGSAPVLAGVCSGSRAGRSWDHCWQSCLCTVHCWTNSTTAGGEGIGQV